MPDSGPTSSLASSGPSRPGLGGRVVGGPVRTGWTDDHAGPATAATRLGQLRDVDTDEVRVGDALRREPDGTWRARPDGHPHEQLAAANTWVIDHNLGYPPGGIRLRDAQGDEIEADVSYPNPATRVVVTFPFGVSIAGTAYLS